MSCCYDVYCLTCHERLGLQDCNHQDEEMATIARLAPALATLARAVNAFLELAYKEPKNTIGIRVEGGWSDLTIPLSWFLKHEGHTLTVRDEYGHLIDECGTYYTCGACQSRKNCRRNKGHEGEHLDKRDSTL